MEPEEAREVWEDQEGHEHREGWEVDTAVRLLEARAIKISGRWMVVRQVEPQIEFVDLEVQYLGEHYGAELHRSETMGYSISLYCDDIEVPESRDLQIEGNVGLEVSTKGIKPRDGDE